MADEPGWEVGVCIANAVVPEGVLGVVVVVGVIWGCGGVGTGAGIKDS